MILEVELFPPRQIASKFNLSFSLEGSFIFHFDPVRKERWPVVCNTRTSIRSKGQKSILRISLANLSLLFFFSIKNINLYNFIEIKIIVMNNFHSGKKDAFFFFYIKSTHLEASRWKMEEESRRRWSGRRGKTNK